MQTDCITTLKTKVPILKDLKLISIEVVHIRHVIHSLYSIYAGRRLLSIKSVRLVFQCKCLKKYQEYLKKVKQIKYTSNMSWQNKQKLLDACSKKSSFMMSTKMWKKNHFYILCIHFILNLQTTLYIATTFQHLWNFLISSPPIDKTDMALILSSIETSLQITSECFKQWNQIIRAVYFR